MKTILIATIENCHQTVEQRDFVNYMLRQAALMNGKTEVTIYNWKSILWQAAELFGSNPIHKSDQIKCGFGGSHFWVSRQDNERILLIIAK